MSDTAIKNTPREEGREILLVEDNPSDALLMEEALKEGSIASRLRVITNGDEALDFLHRKGKHSGAPAPDLIVLDLNLPKKDGREVLAEIKKDQVLMRIPVVIITTSNSEEDVNRSYDLHANCYITKPVRLQQFFDVVKCMEYFWFSVAKLPPKDERQGV